MRAVTMRRGHLELKDVPEPPMTDDHLLVEPLSAGVCGGDLNAMDHADDFLHASRASGTPLFLFDPDRDLVFGHEFTARVREVGANVEGRDEGEEHRQGPGEEEENASRAGRFVLQAEAVDVEAEDD